MKTSQNGVELIKRFEGLVLEAYQDIAGVWTIGYGHTGPDVAPGMRISQNDAEELLRRDLKPREDAVDRLVNVSINQNEFDALVSFVYNVGIEGFRRSTARRRLNNKDRVGAAEALTWWNKATIDGILSVVTGLTRRRAAERALFLEPVNPPIVTDNSQIAENSRMTPVEDAPRRPNLAESRSLQGATVAGGAGVAASSMGRDSAHELGDLESNIETGGMPAAGDPMPPGDAQVDAQGAGDTQAPAADDDDDDGDTSIFDPIPQASGANSGTTTESIETGPMRPSKHEKHAAEAQVQFALLILVVFAVLYIFIARLDDWIRFRR